MAYPVTGSPTKAFVASILSTLTGDATLMSLLGSRIYAHVPEAARVSYPYLVIGRRSRTNDAGAMQVAGSMVSVQIDVFHGMNPDASTNVLGPGTVHTIFSRVTVLLERRDIAVTGFALIGGSLTCEIEDVFDEPDDDAPGQRLYHGVQRWLGEVHEV